MEIKRNRYLNTLISKKHNGLIKVITGMTNAMINAVFTGGVNHGVICIKEPPYR